ncbi:MAG: Gfo/Idh/MocA family oxidoreductase [Thermoprotei archaeon]|nr:Gfo/Idh/MocA family oxidoreductase [Thermoprotei archaeon]
MTKIRFGVIGCGNVANNHYLPYITKVAELVVTCDEVLERARRSASLWGAKRYCDDPDKVFSASDVDAVVILTPHDTHADLAIRAAKAGKHFILQKPIATNMNELKRVVSIVERSGVKAVFEPSEPFSSPLISRIKDLLGQGTMGRPLLFMTYIGHGGPKWSDWFFKEERGGGVIYDLAVYGVADSIYLFGAPNEVNVAATISFKRRLILRPEEHTMTIAPEYYGRGIPMYYQGMEPSVPVEVTAYDNVILTLTYDGLLCSVFANYVTFTKHGIPPLQLFGSKGSIVVPDMRKGEIKLIRDGKEEIIRTKMPRKYYEWSVDHLIECIEKDLTPIPSVKWGEAITEVLIKAHEIAHK